MCSVHRLTVISAALCASAATAAPIESAMPAGLRGHLRIEVTEGGSVARSLILELPVTSEPSGAVNLLAAEGLTEGQQAAWDHRKRTITENMISPEEMTRVWSEFAKACDPAPSSAACAAAKAEVAALEERASGANAQAEAQLAAGPAMDVDNNRFQKWGGNPDRGCGRVVSRVGAAVHSWKHAAGEALTPEAVGICSSELVLDHRTGRAFLRINPLVYFASGDPTGTFDLERLHRSAPNVVVEPGGRLSSPHAILRELQVTGNLHTFNASARLPAKTGAPLNIRVTFRQGE